jgi:hypoxanthine phosphoribosyltransferase
VQNIHPDTQHVLFTDKQISKRIAELAEQLSKDYADIDSPLLLICLLKGAAIFSADLLRKMSINCQLDFMVVSSYGDDSESSSEVRIVKDLDEPIHNRHVLIIDDIIDTGQTLEKICALLKSRAPTSLKTCTLLDKKARRTSAQQADYVGFSIPNDFVVGYGLDYAQNYRNLPYIGVLKPAIYNA